MTAKNSRLSRLVSHALRHEPWVYELELDDAGWTSLDALLESLRSSDAEWATLSRADIEQMISASAKQRHELADARIRASYGHSLPGKLRQEVAEPPPRLFHGTGPEVAEVIMADGLRPMRRQYVHLSVDESTALEVGRRKSPEPCLLVIDAGEASRSGVAFYSGNSRVWLADIVPGRFISMQ